MYYIYFIAVFVTLLSSYLLNGVYLPESFCLNLPLPDLTSLFVIMASSFLIFIFGFIVAMDFFKKSVKKIAIRFLASFVLAVIFAVGVFAGNFGLSVKMTGWAFSRAMGRGKTLISEIEKYKQMNGLYPVRLSELNIKILTTDICSAPDFKYAAGPTKAGGYELSVEIRTNTFSIEDLVYWPSKQYPTVYEGGVVTPAGDWMRVLDVM